LTIFLWYRPTVLFLCTRDRKSNCNFTGLFLLSKVLGSMAKGGRTGDHQCLCSRAAWRILCL